MPNMVWITDNNAVELVGLAEDPKIWYDMVKSAGDEDPKIVTAVNFFLRQHKQDFRVQARRATQLEEFSCYPGLERVVVHHLRLVHDYQPKIGTSFANVYDWQVKFDG